MPRIQRLAMLALPAALALGVATASCRRPSGHRDETRAPSKPLPEGLVYRSKMVGGIGGFDEQVDIGRDGLASLHQRGKVVAVTALGRDEVTWLDSLCKRGRPIGVESSPSSPPTPDEMYGLMQFAGEGTDDVRDDLSRLTQAVGARLAMTAQVWRSALVVIGRLKEAPPVDTAADVRIHVERVLKQPDDFGLQPGIVVQHAKFRLGPMADWDQPRGWVVNHLRIRRDGEIWHVDYISPLQLGPEAVAEAVASQAKLAPGH